jgi:aminobenzoyl-glutamate transport protein
MILAPIFVPMFYNLGVSPEITQLAYRIGDSVTNNLTPLNAALLTSVALMSQYRIPELNPEEPGVGTVLSAQFPFSFCFLITFVIWLAVFLFAGIPVGIV